MKQTNRLNPLEIKSRLSLVEVATAYGVKLTRYRGPCPVCQTSATSQAFSIFGDQRDRWRCHACGESGDVFSLMQAVERITFAEALEKGAKQVGVTAGTVAIAPRVNPEAERRARISAAFQYAATLHRHASKIASSDTSSIWDRLAAKEARETLERTMDSLVNGDADEQDAAAWSLG